MHSAEKARDITLDNEK